MAKFMIRVVFTVCFVGQLVLALACILLSLQASSLIGGLLSIVSVGLAYLYYGSMVGSYSRFDEGPSVVFDVWNHPIRETKRLLKGSRDE